MAASTPPPRVFTAPGSDGHQPLALQHQATSRSSCLHRAPLRFPAPAPRSWSTALPVNKRAMAQGNELSRNLLHSAAASLATLAAE